jgi:predicted nucleotidyltransferase
MAGDPDLTDDTRMSLLERALVDRLIDVISKEPAVRLAVLFGSTARGETGRRSDVDVAIRLGSEDQATRVRIEAALGIAAGRALDWIEMDEASPLARFEIARDGVLLVERDPHAWAEFRARAMIDWWDWAPTQRKIDRAAMDRIRAEAGGGSR